MITCALNVRPFISPHDTRARCQLLPSGMFLLDLLSFSSVLCPLSSVSVHPFPYLAFTTFHHFLFLSSLYFLLYITSYYQFRLSFLLHFHPIYYYAPFPFPETFSSLHLSHIFAEFIYCYYYLHLILYFFSSPSFSSFLHRLLLFSTLFYTL